ncbi:CGNR zinc finger domain-containing protein [Salinibacterium sp. G-O1]|uniref:CGNR zinc finger domain-containing protein n=1 Tax=Salinibacterium sp. G-O1 TaxID=3046208 RepID=UPI0024BA391D|nr:CGNR zinc finger domain-containing protein [Salinibacterium sp. G-O1]MDJ0334113.1 CGNR zinc finger domain-containing protein [Salinibacterium sp. G-O1]
MGTEAGQWFTSGDGHRWHFDAGSLALDFAYTGPMDGTPAQETIDSPTDLAGWLDERFPEVDGTATDRDLVDALTLRAVIARSAIAISRGLRPAEDDVDVINLFAATPDIPPALAGGRRQAGRAHARVSQTLSVMAREVVELFSADRADRIRQCSADDCQLIFYDESRSNNRRWCSMQRCGNRAKVRAHRARLR